MPGLTRAGARALALLLFLVLPFALFAGDSQVSPDCRTLFTSEALGTSATVTSTAFVQLGKAKDVSVQIQVLGTSPNYTVSVVTSLDESTYALPETGAVIGTFTGAGTKIAPISVPFCKGLKIVVLNNSGANTGTITATVCSQ